MSTESQTTRIIISLPKQLLEDLDEYAKTHRYNRSELIRHAIRTLIRGNHEPVQEN